MRQSQRLVALGVLLCVLNPAPAQSPQPAGGLDNIRFLPDGRVFAVMAALNIAGFDLETPGREMSIVRTKVRQRLVGIDPYLKARLQAFYNEAISERIQDLDQPQTVFTSLALLLSPPPELKLQLKPADLPADVWQIRGFADLASELYREADLESLWQEVKPSYEQELAAYLPTMRQVIVSVLDYFRTPARLMLDRQITVIADLLDVQDIVNARNLEREYYIVVGPTMNPESNRQQLEHEYLHFLVDPLMRKFGLPLLKHDKLLDLVQRQPNVRSDYQNQLLLMAAESLVECLQMRLHPPPTQMGFEEQIVRLFREGLILAPYFHRELEKYEQSDWLSLPAYLETTVASVKRSEIEEDSENIVLLEEIVKKRSEEEEASRKRAELEVQRRSEVGQLLGEVKELLEANRFPETRAKLERVLELEPGHGHALFYLAQVASQMKDYDEAYLLYQRSAQAPNVPVWVHAWSRLRMGRILASQGKFEEARAQFESIRTLQGELQGALGEAEQLIKQLPKP